MVGDARKRLDDLLLARATEGLNAADTLELESLLAAEPRVDAGAYERAAAAVCLAVFGARSALPGGLRARLEQQAAELRGKPPSTR